MKLTQEFIDNLELTSKWLSIEYLEAELAYKRNLTEDNLKTLIGLRVITQKFITEFARIRGRYIQQNEQYQKALLESLHSQGFTNVKQTDVN